MSEHTQERGRGKGGGGEKGKGKGEREKEKEKGKRERGKGKGERGKGKGEEEDQAVIICDRYLLDMSRIFPPCAPNLKFKHSHLYQLFRPEFVKNYRTPLCSDGFSGFLSGMFLSLPLPPRPS
jgi:hypothetical protein